MKRPAGVLENDVQAMGCCPQAQTLGDGYDRDAPNSVYMLDMRSLPDFEPNFGQVTLEPRAVVTDLLECPALSMTKGFIASSRMRSVLDRFELQPHRWFELPVVQRQLRKPKAPPVPVGTYYWIHVPALVPVLSADKREAEAQVTAMFPNAELVNVCGPSQYSGIYLGGELKQALVDAGITGVRFRFARLFR